MWIPLTNQTANQNQGYWDGHRATSLIVPPTLCWNVNLEYTLLQRCHSAMAFFFLKGHFYCKFFHFSKDLFPSFLFSSSKKGAVNKARREVCLQETKNKMRFGLWKVRICFCNHQGIVHSVLDSKSDVPAARNLALVCRYNVTSQL